MSVKLQREYIVNILFLFVIIEVCCHGVFNSLLHVKVIAWIYFLSGILIASLPLISFHFSKIKRRFIFYSWLYPLILSFIFAGFIPVLQSLFESIPINYKFADMLPVIKIMCERFMGGSNPYSVIPEIWGGMQPIYLPAMWLPFLPTVYFDIDLRWTNYLLLYLSLIALWIIGNYRQTSSLGVLILIPVFILMLSLTTIEKTLFAFSEEGVVLAYYIFLCLGLFMKNKYVIAIGLVLCLLSRFSLIGWSVFFIVLLYNQNKLKARWIIVCSGVLGFFLMISTRAILHLYVFLGLSQNYSEALSNDFPKYQNVIATSLGAAKFFRKTEFWILESMFKLFLILIPVMCWFFYKRFKDRINDKFIFICSLKLSLVFFYNFLIIPYEYLFYTSTVVSIGILYFYLEEYHIVHSNRT